jgi:dTDP-L-rhamnose 4-epimerase
MELTMSGKTILITGGAGFVGSHSADALVGRGHKVKVFDNLCAQVHNWQQPSYLAKEIEFIHSRRRARPGWLERGGSRR